MSQPTSTSKTPLPSSGYCMTLYVPLRRIHPIRKPSSRDPELGPSDLTDFCGWHLARRSFLIGIFNTHLLNRSAPDRSAPDYPSERVEHNSAPVTLFSAMEERRSENGLPSWRTRSQAWRAYYAIFSCYLTQRGRLLWQTPLLNFTSYETTSPRAH